MIDHKHIHCGGQLSPIDMRAGIPAKCKCGAYTLLPRDHPVKIGKNGNISNWPCPMCKQRQLRTTAPYITLYICTKCESMINIILSPSGEDYDKRAKRQNSGKSI